MSCVYEALYPVSQHTFVLGRKALATAVGQYLQLNEDGSVSPDAGSGTRALVAQAVETGVAGELIEAILFRSYTAS
ncbi:MAG: hypothetical protein ACFB21_14130 [Opitutales bacterium]